MPRSWDFWDTLVTRCVPSPADVFALVERSTGVVGFHAARVAAEHQSRVGVPETSLERIYAQMPYGDDVRRRLMRAELDAECLLASPMRANTSRFEQGDVILSDMYLDRATMQRIATACGLQVGLEDIHVSSDYGATKHTGALFDRVLAQRPFTSHIGDNRHSDFKVPAAKGIAASHWKEGEATDIERRLLAGTPEEHLISGVHRATRLAEPAYAGHVKGEWAVYTQWVAPLLLAFVDWVLRRSLEQGIQDLFFLARDGQILHRIATRLVESRGLSMRCHYLYASRQALHLPGHVSMQQSASWIFENTSFLSIEVIAERVGADASAVHATASRYVDCAATANLDGAQRQQLAVMARDAEFGALVESSAAGALDAAQAYFRQAGLFLDTDAPVGIVDVGWVGRMQRSLQGVADKARARSTIHGFYLGLLPGSVHQRGDRLTGMLADPFRPHAPGGGAWVAGYRGMFEFLLRADHPTTLGYARDANGRVNPLFAPAVRSDSAEEVRRKQAAVMAFVDRYCRVEGLWGPGLTDGLAGACDNVRRLLMSPRAWQARIFCNQEHSEHQVERDLTPLVKRVSWKDALARRSPARQGIWPEAGYALSHLLWLYRARTASSRWLGR